jgi:leader peptidase (prepilin peptidase)/N-methyltransferase
VKLAAVAGAWVDWRLLPYVVEAAALVGLALALVHARRNGSARADMKLPFAVGFAPAIFLGWSLGQFGC